MSLFLLDGPISAGADYFAGLPGATVESHTGPIPTCARCRSPASAGRSVATPRPSLGRSGGPLLFRPPYGNYDANTPRAAADCGIVAMSCGR